MFEIYISGHGEEKEIRDSIFSYLSRQEIIMFIVMFKHHVSLLGEFAKFEKRLLASPCLSVRPSAWNYSAPTGRIFMKVDKYFSNICRKNKNFIKSDKNTGYFTRIPLRIYDYTSLTSS